MKDFFKNTFDFVVSLGYDCGCTSYLRRCYLQNNSYPFDWLTGANVITRAELIANNFENFLNLEDFEEIKKVTYNHNETIFDLYKNKRTNLFHYHDFPIGIPIEKSLPEIKEKYERRIKRLYEKIENSQKILFVWLSQSNNKKLDFVESYDKLVEKFKDKEIYFLVIQNSQEENIELLKENHLLIVEQDTASDDKKHHFDATMGNKTNNLRIFNKIKIKTTLKEKLIRFLYKIATFLTYLIPNRAKRQATKQKINMFFYHAKL